MMSYILTKLNNRHKCSKFFTHRAQIYTPGRIESLELFINVREWMTDQFGQSIELDYFDELKKTRDFKLKWSWKVDINNRYFIYFNDDKILNWFTLKY